MYVSAGEHAAPAAADRGVPEPQRTSIDVQLPESGERLHTVVLNDVTVVLPRFIIHVIIHTCQRL